MKSTNTIKIPINITDENLEDILETAFISTSYWLYWGCIKKCGKGKFNYTLLVPEDDTDTEFKKYTLTKNKLLKGVREYISKYGCNIEDGELDTCSIDGWGCDIILQYALFNEVVFG